MSGRLIWISDDDFGVTYAEFHRRMRALWDAAPADPADAAHRAVRSMFVGKRGESEALCAIADGMADAALGALGAPPCEHEWRPSADGSVCARCGESDR